MISFILSVIFLILGYYYYGSYVEKNFGPDDRQTPAYAINDGVDYIPMPLWKVYLIQFLNIAGTGPIFGALFGAIFGPIVYFWIVLGCIFAGAVHDYMCGMLSVRNNGASVSEITGKYLGNWALQLMRVFSIILLIMCGVVFTSGPASLLDLITPEKYTATFVLWACSVYLLNEKKNWLVTVVPATFMTAVVTAYIIAAPEGFNKSYSLAVTLGIIASILALGTFLIHEEKLKQTKA